MQNVEHIPTDQTPVTPVEAWGQLASSESLQPRVFEPFVGDVFRVHRQRFETTQTHVNPLYVRDESSPEEPATIVELTLVQVTRYPRLKALEGGFDHRPREPFALLFLGPDDVPLIAAVHTIAHEELGQGKLFLTPVLVPTLPGSEEPPGISYEVAFN